jgi:hypothetical protein
MKLRVGQFWKAAKVALKVEQALEKVGVVPQNKIDDKIVQVVEAIDNGRKDKNSNP